MLKAREVREGPRKRRRQFAEYAKAEGWIPIA